MNSWISLLPPLIAIALAIQLRKVFLALGVGIVVGVFLLSKFNLARSVDVVAGLATRVFLDQDNLMIFGFSLLMGAIVALLTRSQAVNGFVAHFHQHGVVDSGLKARAMTVISGTLLFLEGSMSILTTGTMARPFFRRFRLSKEKLAYLCDATCSPVAVLIPLNGWGAFLMSNFSKGGVENPFDLLWQSIPFFFYPMVAYVLVVLAIFRESLFRGMRVADEDAESEPVDEPAGSDQKSNPNPFYFVVPILAMVLGMISFMYFSGEGDIRMGNGSQAMLYSTAVTALLMMGLYGFSGLLNIKELLGASFEGMKNLAPIVFILAAAFMLNTVCKDLGTGSFIAQNLVGNFPTLLMPFLIFITSAFISFSTGTSWGTFAIMLAFVFPLATSLQLHAPLVIGAVVSGGVWGDHCSPVSDTTILSSMASGCDLHAHIRTQLPFALLGGGVAACGFLISGWLV